MTVILSIIVFLLTLIYFIRLERTDELALLQLRLENQDVCRKVSNLAESVYVTGPGATITTELPPRRTLRVAAGRLLEVSAELGYIEACLLPTPEVRDGFGSLDFTITNRTISLTNMGEGVVEIKDA
ncbi:MAG: hypothetical protein ABH950_09610 [Candidatus Altiarchaeota archaeon]